MAGLKLARQLSHGPCETLDGEFRLPHRSFKNTNLAASLGQRSRRFRRIGEEESMIKQLSWRLSILAGMLAAGADGATA
jgi:hypothetical protein